MTKVGALMEIIREAKAQQGSKAALARLRQALKVLELTPVETIEVEKWLDYRSPINGEIYQQFRSH